jgi:hypothetical protein
MLPSKIVGKREFIQHTSKYIKWLEEHEETILITHHNKPALLLTRIKPMTIKDMRGFAEIKIHGDINDPILPGYDEW